jgi:dipeptidase
MCDTIVIARSEGVLFAKNSDRDPNEAQGVEWHPRRMHEPGAQLHCTWITIPQVHETNAVLISRPFWMWGAETGANEHGLAIGNEAVFTRQPYQKLGLIGMDLVRLALERAASARQACEVITDLLEQHGQGGGCGYENRRFTYHNSFLIADPARAFVLDTAGRQWAIEEVSGVRTISNGLTTAGFAEQYSDFLYTRISACRLRRDRTQRLAEQAQGVKDLFKLLRDHGGERPEPRYSWLNGGMSAPCMHAGGLLAASQTTASWVSELRSTGSQHWVTGTAAPCTGLFKPVQVGSHIDAGPFPLAEPDESLWWRHERFHRIVMRNPLEIMPPFAAERDALETQWVLAPPDAQLAWDEANGLLERWTRAVQDRLVRDSRPLYVRRYWSRRRPQALRGCRSGRNTECRKA